MGVRVEVSSGLRRFLDSYDPARGLELPARGLTPARLLEQLGIPPEEVALVMVNRRPAPRDQELEDGDLVGVFPPLGGG